MAQKTSVHPKLRDADAIDRIARRMVDELQNADLVDRLGTDTPKSKTSVRRVEADLDEMWDNLPV